MLKLRTHLGSFKFETAEHLASRLSMTLGVGKISDTRLSQALLNFMQEGIRYAFDGDANQSDDLVLGSRLPFLQILSKYSTWIKKNNSHRRTLGEFILAKEDALRAHPEFNEVHPDDLAHITHFQDAIGVAEPRRRRVSPEKQEDMSVGRGSHRSTPGSAPPSAGSRRQMSVASSSQRSRVSVQSNLSPLLESPEDRDSSSPSPQKRRRLTGSLPELDESRIEEENSDDSSSM